MSQILPLLPTLKSPALDQTSITSHADWTSCSEQILKRSPYPPPLPHLPPSNLFSKSVKLAASQPLTQSLRTFSGLVTDRVKSTSSSRCLASADFILQGCLHHTLCFNNTGPRAILQTSHTIFHSLASAHAVFSSQNDQFSPVLFLANSWSLSLNTQLA